MATEILLNLLHQENRELVLHSSQTARQPGTGMHGQRERVLSKGEAKSEKAKSLSCSLRKHLKNYCASQFCSTKELCVLLIFFHFPVSFPCSA